MITEKAYAKVNLTLHITGKREDGYHTLESIMHTVPVFDEVRIEKSREITVECGDISGKDNIAYKAAVLFFEYIGICGGAEISIVKKIPVCAGFGGGSADGAAVIRGLNKLYETNLNSDEMRGLALKLGADVPFLIEGGTCICRGIGEILTPLNCKCELYFCLCKGKCSASTKAMYEEIDKHNVISSANDNMLESLKNNDIIEVCNSLHNDFDEVCVRLYPEIAELKNMLVQNGALGAMLSGSGTGVFGIFKTQSQAEIACNELKCAGIEAYIG